MEKLNHAPYCKHTAVCSSCGRPICPHCCKDDIDMCLVCSGMFREDEIILPQSPKKYYRKRGERMLRLDGYKMTLQFSFQKELYIKTYLDGN